MRAQTITPREMTTGQRQIRVGELMATHDPEAIAEQLGVDVEVIREDLADIGAEGFTRPTRPRPGTAECGTPRGYQAHKSRKEEACDECLLAYNRDQQARSIRGGRQRALRVSITALGALYLDATAEQQKRLADELGADVCEALVDYYRGIQRATGR